MPLFSTWSWWNWRIFDICLGFPHPERRAESYCSKEICGSYPYYTWKFQPFLVSTALCFLEVFSKPNMLVLRAYTMYGLTFPRNLRLSVCVQHTLSAHIFLSGKCQVPLTIGKCSCLMRITVLTDLWLLWLHVNSKDIIVLTSVPRPTCLPAQACSMPLEFWWSVWHTFVSSFTRAGSTTKQQAQSMLSLIS